MNKKVQQLPQIKKKQKIHKDLLQIGGDYFNSTKGMIQQIPKIIQKANNNKCKRQKNIQQIEYRKQRNLNLSEGRDSFEKTPLFLSNLHLSEDELFEIKCKVDQPIQNYQQNEKEKMYYNWKTRAKIVSLQQKKNQKGLSEENRQQLQQIMQKKYFNQFDQNQVDDIKMSSKGFLETYLQDLICQNENGLQNFYRYGQQRQILKNLRII